MDNEKVALVTGGSRGIGRAIAIKLSSIGYKVAINFRKRVDDANETLRIIQENGGEGALYKADVSKSDEVMDMISRIRNDLGRVTVLVNNAGIGLASPFHEMSEEMWDRQINVSLKSVYLVTKCVLKDMMEARWGRIINLSSIAGIIGAEYLSAYSAAKAGIIGLTKALAIELAKYNITVNAIAPGFTETKLGLSYFQWLDYITSSQGSLNRFLQEKTLTRELVKTDEVADLVALLVDHKARNITGQVFIIDSGTTLASGKVPE